MEMNGIAHIQITVNDFERCVSFYEKLFAFFEMKVIFSTPDFYYGVGSRTGLAVSRAAPEHRDARFAQRRIGLHHICFRAREREDVDRVHDFLRSIGATIVHPPEDGSWAPGYYSVLFEDPDGIRLEVNHVPGQGNLAPGIELPKRAYP
ncbi:MAG TPA: VOC family protein [Candidatus Binatia bacterium]|nr:VOC family protein [Candidatus Binatia bacterium]